jgi:hypothetical protein
MMMNTKFKSHNVHTLFFASFKKSRNYPSTKLSKVRETIRGNKNTLLKE